MTPTKDMALLPMEQTPLATIVERLVTSPDADMAKLERFLDFQERVLRHNAKAAFDGAFTALQGDLPTIIERGRTHTGTRYATLEDIVEQVRPVLQKHGFALSHRTEWPEDGKVRIIGILSHTQGHERTSEFVTGADTSGSKNQIQGLGSALSYGRRYTTKDLLNIVTRDEDDDGRLAGQPVTDPDGFSDWCADMALVGREQGLKALQDAWKKSSDTFRQHMTKHYTARWEAIKSAAAKVKA